MNTDKVLEIINKWDPINLMPFAPYNEYIVEVNMIINGLETINDVDELSQKIFEIFIAQFGDDVFSFDITECRNIAELIIK